MGRIIYFLSCALVVGAGLWVVFYYGLQPRSVPKIDLSFFDLPEAASQAVAERLRQDWPAMPILLIGVYPNHPEEIAAARGLIQSLSSMGIQTDAVVVEPGFPGTDDIPGTRVSLHEEASRFAEGVKNALAQRKRLIAIGPVGSVSNLVEGSASSTLKNDEHIEVATLSIAPFPRTREEEKGFEVQCDTQNDSPGSLGALGCVALQKARELYRKKKDPAKYAATLDLVGLHDYLMLLAPPVPAAP